MNNYTVDRYFIQVGPGLDPATVVGGPVLSQQDSRPLGVIRDYNTDDGFVIVQLFDGVPYMRLVKDGVPMNHIIFGKE